jgi:carbon monoxide dehydrogenase subunit G
MEISGSYTLYAPRERVWAFLLDPEKLRATIPGCEELEQLGPDRYRLRLNVGVAAVRGIYSGTLALSDLHPPESYTLSVDGSGARGVLHGNGTLNLEAPKVGTTNVSYVGQAQIGGAIASLGSRLAQNAARTLINQFFARVADGLAADETPAPTRAATPADAKAPYAAQADPLRGETAGAEWGMGIPEALPLGAELAPVEAVPIPAAGPVSSHALATQPRAARNSPQLGQPAMPNPAPAFLTDLVRRAGLSNGSVESEQRIAWRLLLGAGGVAFALVVGVVGLFIERSRR